jgi:hypothetical protein
MNHRAALAACLLLGACDAGDYHRMLDVSQGTLVAGLGMPMGEVARRSSLRLNKLPSLGLPTGNYADGNAYFDFELAGSPVRFHGCSMYSINYSGPEEAITSISVFITPGRLRWKAFGQELRQTAAQLKAAGWQPDLHDGWEPLEAFLARDGSQIESTPSDVVATFDWKQDGEQFRLSAHRAWNEARFWSSFELTDADPVPAGASERWLDEFPAYAGAREVCSQHVLGAPGSRPVEIAWSLYSTPDAPDAVVEFYARSGHMAARGGDPRLELASGDGNSRLSVHAVSGSFPDCGVKPPKGTRTVLIVSQALP